ncbi:hypothetical protein METHP15_40068 [Pseudomonas sp. P15-2025]
MMPCSAVMATDPFMAMMGKCANSPSGKCLAEAPEARITTGPCWELRHASKPENAPRSALGCDGSVFINGIFNWTVQTTILIRVYAVAAFT